jgi:hypothetical protein
MSAQEPNRRPVRSLTVLGLFALFVVAVVVVLIRRLFPDRVSAAAERLLRRGR